MAENPGKRRLILMVFYEGPWDRLAALCYGIRRSGPPRWEEGVNPKSWKRLLRALGDYCDRRDHAWRERYVLKGERPHTRWKRRDANTPEA